MKKIRPKTIRVNRLQGRIFFFCEEGIQLEPFFPDMKFEKVWKKCGYEITYDLRKIDRSEKKQNK